MIDKSVIQKDNKQLELDYEIDKIINIKDKSKSFRKKKEFQKNFNRLVKAKNVNLFFKSNVYVSQSRANLIFENLMKAINIEELTLQINKYSQFNTEIPLQISACISQLPHLKSLLIQISKHSQVKSCHIRQIFQSCQSLKYIEKLQFRICGIEIEQNDLEIAEQSLRNLNSLTQLDLCLINTKLTDQGYKSIANIISNLQNSLKIFRLNIFENNIISENSINNIIGALISLKVVYLLDLKMNFLEIKHSSQQYLLESFEKLDSLKILLLEIQKKKVLMKPYFIQSLKNLLHLKLNINNYLNFENFTQIFPSCYNQLSKLKILDISFDDNFTGSTKDLGEVLKQLNCLNYVKIKSKQNNLFGEEGLINLYNRIKECKLKYVMIQIQEPFALCFLGLIHDLNKYLLYLQLIHFKSKPVSYYCNNNNKRMLLSDNLHKQYINEEQGIKGLSFAFNQFTDIKILLQYVVFNGDIQQLQMFQKSLGLSSFNQTFELNISILKIKHMNFNLFASSFENQQNISSLTLTINPNILSCIEISKIIHNIGLWKNLKKLSLDTKKGDFIVSDEIQINLNEQQSELEYLSVSSKLKLHDIHSDHFLYVQISQLINLQTLCLDIEESQYNNQNYLALANAIKSLPRLRKLKLTLYDSMINLVKESIISINMFSNIRQLKLDVIYLVNHDFLSKFIVSSFTNLEGISLNNINKQESVLNLLQSISQLKKLTKLRIDARKIQLNAIGNQNMMESLLKLQNLSYLNIHSHSYYYFSQFKLQESQKQELKQKLIRLTIIKA